MEIQISTDELRKRKIFCATPMYGGQCNGMYMKACLDLQSLLQKYNIETRFSFLFNESLIPRARNYLADEFLRAEGFDYLLFLDADIHFDPNDVITMLAMDKDIIGGPYPKKSINWGAVKAAIINNYEKRKVDPAFPDLDPGALETVVGEYVFNPVAGTQQFSVFEPLEVMEIGTGYMMIKRSVFDKFKETFPMTSYKPDHGGQQHFDGRRYINAYFDCRIDYKDSLTGGGSDRYLSEDYWFCQMARKMGYKIWLCPWMETTHLGTYGFKGNLKAVANLTGKL